MYFCPCLCISGINRRVKTKNKVHLSPCFYLRKRPLGPAIAVFFGKNELSDCIFFFTRKIKQAWTTKKKLCIQNINELHEQLSLEALLQVQEWTEKLAVAESVELAALLPDDEKAAWATLFEESKSSETVSDENYIEYLAKVLNRDENEFVQN